VTVGISKSVSAEIILRKLFRMISDQITSTSSNVFSLFCVLRVENSEEIVDSLLEVSSNPFMFFSRLVLYSILLLIISILSFTSFYIVFIISLLVRKDYSTPWLLLLEGYYLQILLLFFISSFAILLSLFLTPAPNIVVSLLFYFGSNWFGVSIPGYIYFPHLELFDLKERVIHAQSIVPGWVILFLTIYAICWTIFFLYLSWLVFRRRNL